MKIKILLFRFVEREQKLEMRRKNETATLEQNELSYTKIFRFKISCYKTPLEFLFCV